MANLRELRDKLNTVKSTRKLTAAMKLVAGVKLRKSEIAASEAMGYSHGLKRIVSGIRQDFLNYKPVALIGRSDVKTELIVVFFADKGLCGGFNYNLIKESSAVIHAARSKNRNVKVLCLCQKAYDALKHIVNDNSELVLFNGIKKNDISYENAESIGDYILSKFDAGDIDLANLVYTKYSSAMSKNVVTDQVVPVLQDEAMQNDAMVIFEHDEKQVLDELIRCNLISQIYQALLENFASEQSARMVAMDNATRNADEIVGKLGLKYNRLRQSMITLELVEVISGAESLSQE